MSDNSAIEWTDHTFSPWWGCSRVSPACVHCYADSQAQRYGHQVWRRKGPRRMLSEANWSRPLKWNRDAERAGIPAKVFCASMADVFEDHPQVAEPRKRLWDLIEATPWLQWQLLTKRIENVAGMVPWGDSWPSWVWLGTSVENQVWADRRIPVLLEIPARVRFLSCEPLLSDIDLSRWLRSDVGEHGGGKLALDDQDGLQGLQERPDISHTPDHPCADGLPSAPLSAVVIPSDVAAAHLFLQPVDDLSRGAVDGDARSGRSASAVAHGEMTLPIQKAGDVAKGRRLGGHLDRLPTQSGSLATKRASVGSEAPLHGGARRSVFRGDLGDGGPGEVRSLDLRNGQFDFTHNPHCINWLIAGGESGPKSRRTNPAWIASLRDQCQSAGVPFFMKQAGAVLAREWGCTDRKGHNPDEWPEPFPRQFPLVAEMAGAA